MVYRIKVLRSVSVLRGPGVKMPSKQRYGTRDVLSEPSAAASEGPDKDARGQGVGGYGRSARGRVDPLQPEKHQ